MTEAVMRVQRAQVHKTCDKMWVVMVVSYQDRFSYRYHIPYSRWGKATSTTIDNSWSSAGNYHIATRAQ